MVVKWPINNHRGGYLQQDGVYLLIFIYLIPLICYVGEKLLIHYIRPTTVLNYVHFLSSYLIDLF